MKYTIHRTNGTSIMVFIVPSTRTNRPLRRENTSNRSTAGLSFPGCSPEERFLRYNTLSDTKCGPYPVSLSWLSNCPCSWTDSVTYSMSRMELVSNFHTISFVVNSTVARQVQQSLSRLSMFFRRHNHQLLVRDLLYQLLFPDFQLKETLSKELTRSCLLSRCRVSRWSLFGLYANVHHQFSCPWPLA